VDFPLIEIPKENGKVASEYLGSHPVPDLVLLDFMMPIMDGKMFCEERKKDELIRQIPVAPVNSGDYLQRYN
jgi:CheY-like chemotaxis protein